MVVTSLKYDTFDEETKLYINRVIDMYLLIKEKELLYYSKDYFHGGTQKLAQVDKKVYSFLLATVSLNEKTRKPFDDVDDFNLDEYFKFIGLGTEIPKSKPLSEEEYKEIYEDDFRVIMQIFLETNATCGTNIVKISPELIIVSLAAAYGNVPSKIVEQYFIQHSPDICILSSNNPLFGTLTTICENKGCFTHEKIVKESPDNSSVDLSDMPFDFSERQIKEKTSKEVKKKETSEMKIDLSKSKIWEYVDTLKKKFIGQEEFAEILFYNIVNNVQLSQMKDVPSGERSIIFVDGPSGTGKTAITTDIADKLGVPCICSSITHYTASGYVGGDLKDLLEKLYEKSGHDLKLAQRGIIIIDEFDKIAINGDHDLTMKQAVQDQLLSLLGGEKYSIRSGMTKFSVNEIEFDTSKLTFVCLGAITNLREDKTSPKQVIGFQTEKREAPDEYSIKPEDLIEMGLEKELVGRINTFLHTRDYSLEDLEKILRESTISPMLGFKEWIERFNKKAILDDEVYRLIAEKAYDLNTGARSLQTIMNSIRTIFIKSVLRGEEKEIHLGVDDVNAAYAKTVNRAVRG